MSLTALTRAIRLGAPHPALRAASPRAACPSAGRRGARFGRRGGGAAPWTTAIGLRLATTADYVLGGGSQFNAAILGVLIRWVPDAVGADATLCVAGTGNYGTGGWLLGSEGYGGQSSDRGHWIGYSTTPTATNTENYTLPTDEIITRQKIITVYLRCVASTTHHLYVDGRQVGIGSATAPASFAHATNALGINRRSSAATIGYGAMTVVEIQCTTAALTEGQIYDAMNAPPGTTLPGAGTVRHLVASDLGAAGAAVPATWTDRIGGVSYTITSVGASLVTCSRGNAGAGSIEIMGDSIAAGRKAAGTLAQGWRREAIKTVQATRFASLHGQYTFTAADTPLDFDPRHTAVGGQCLGINNGTATRLSTLAADVAITIPTDGTTVLAYGINDLYKRITTDGGTAAAATAAFLADVDTAIGLIRVSRSGPILIQTILRGATGSYSATVRSAIDLVNAGLPAQIATSTATHGGTIRLVDCTTAVTPDQAAADDTGVLYDGTHPTPTTYTGMAAVYAAAFLGL